MNQAQRLALPPPLPRCIRSVPTVLSRPPSTCTMTSTVTDLGSTPIPLAAIWVDMPSRSSDGEATMELNTGLQPTPGEPGGVRMASSKSNLARSVSAEKCTPVLLTLHHEAGQCGTVSLLDAVVT